MFNTSPNTPPMHSQAHNQLFIGLMSGTSMDGVDGVLVAFPADFPLSPCQRLAFASRDFPAKLREQLQILQAPSENEIEREALAANQLVQLYAEVVQCLLQAANCRADQVKAIGVHGQTIRHRPEMGFTRQMNNPALLAELTSIDVIADFRSRDVAAGGQGAPLVPAFHEAIFAAPDTDRVVLNLGGMANISVLQASGKVTGFDTGPGNVLLDMWIGQQRQLPYDDNGAWAASGSVNQVLLQKMLQEPYFSMPAPKSTGRDLFDAAWLAKQLQGCAIAPADVQASLLALTVQTCVRAIAREAPAASAVYVCGGGARNASLMAGLQTALPLVQVASTAQLGVPVQEVEALAFAWLARQHCLRLPANLPLVTGARGQRVLGACYPA